MIFCKNTYIFYRIKNELIPFAEKYYNLPATGLSIFVKKDNENCDAYYDLYEPGIPGVMVIQNRITNDCEYFDYVFFHEFTHFWQHMTGKMDPLDQEQERQFVEQYPDHPFELEAINNGIQMQEEFYNVNSEI